MVNKSFLDRIVQLSSDSVIAIDDKQKIIYANPGASETFGYEISEMVGQPLTILLPAELGARHEEHVKQFAKTKRTSKMMNNRQEISGRRKDGTLFPAQANILKFEDKGQRYFAVMLRDVTEFHDHFRRINNLAKFPDENPNPVMRLGTDGSLIYGNPGSRVLQKEWGVKTGDKLPDEVCKHLFKAVKKAKVLEVEVRVKRDTYSLMIVPIKSESYVNVYGKNITNLKQAEERTVRQLSRLAGLRSIDIAITAGLDKVDILDVVLTQTVNELRVHAADILLLDPADQHLSYAAGSGFHTGHFKHAHLALGEGYAGKIARTLETCLILDIAADGNSVRPPSAFQEEGFITYIGVPLIAKGIVKGVMEVFMRQTYQPDDEWLDYLETLAGQAAIAMDNTELFEGLQQANADLSKAYNETLEGWSRALDLRDRETEGHTQRVTERTVEMARAMGFDEDLLVHIQRGALLHDIGKMGVPDSILLKPGPLSDDEWKVMRMHPQLAYNMLSPIEFLRPALNIPYYHHEKWDGSGYPSGLKGEEIPLEARVFAIIDVCDALASDRPYRKAWPLEKIQKYIRDESGSHFDPAVVEVFFEFMAKEMGELYNL